MLQSYSACDTVNRLRTGGPRGWLLLVYQLPGNPSNARVKTWRRLQNVGAVALKNSAYVLPNSPQTREDFEWIKAEIGAMKGEATLLLAENLDSVSEREIVASFLRSRRADYERLRHEAENLFRKVKLGRRASPLRRENARTARALRERLAALMAIDFFHAPGRRETAAILSRIERRLAGSEPTLKDAASEREALMAEKFQSKTWVTRPRPGIDRMASAWLIRSFIDPAAKFVFADKAEAQQEAVPFDMYGVGFSHEGNNCTFETLARKFRVAGLAIERIGEIVHNLDLKDEKYQVPEDAVVGRLVEGLREVHADDGELLERGMEMFEALYRSFTSRPHQTRRMRGKRPSKASASFLGLA